MVSGIRMDQGTWLVDGNVRIGADDVLSINSLDFG
jgi:hypothetical protein